MGSTLFENEFIRQGILLGNELDCAVPLLAAGDGMQVAEIIDRILDATGWNQTRLAKRIGVSQGNIAKWKSGIHSPNKKVWDNVISLIHSDPRLADLRVEVDTGSVGIMGRVGAGSIIEPDVEQIPPDGLYSVTLPFPAPENMIGFVVEGDSMLPKYEAGDVIVVYEHQRLDTLGYLGSLVIVRTEDGRRYLKKLFAGSARGLFRLESFNASPIQDVSIAWVGEIYATLPAAQVFRPEKKELQKRNTANKSRRAGAS